MKNWTCVLLVCLCAGLFVSEASCSQAESMTALVPKETKDGWVAKGTPQAFSKETLFEHINGQADLFLQYGFEKSVYAVYENKNASHENIDVDLYDMGNVVHSFGIFSRFRQEHKPAGIGLDSYLDDRYAIFYKGKYFAVLQATESSTGPLTQLARMIESRIKDDSPPPKELEYFPKEGLKPGSIEYHPQGLMGRQVLKRGFKATYVVKDRAGETSQRESDDADASLFLAIFDKPEEARAALGHFKELLAKSSLAQTATSMPSGLETLKGDDPYQGKLMVVLKGRYLAGAAGFETEKDSERLLTELLRKIE